MLLERKGGGGQIDLSCCETLMQSIRLWLIVIDYDPLLVVIRTACLFLGNESKTTETNVTRRPAQSVVDQSWIKMAATFPTLPPIFSFTWWGKTSTRQGLCADWKQGTYWSRTNQCFLLTVSCKCPVYWFFQSSSTVLSGETNKSQGYQRGVVGKKKLFGKKKPSDGKERSNVRVRGG